MKHKPTFNALLLSAVFLSSNGPREYHMVRKRSERKRQQQLHVTQHRLQDHWIKTIGGEKAFFSKSEHRSRKRGTKEIV